MVEIKTPKYVIQQAEDKPSFVRQHWVIFSLLGLAILTFLIGRYSHLDVLQAFKGQKQTWSEINQQLSDTKEANQKTISLLKTEVKIKEQAIKELQLSISQMSEDNSLLKAEVAFYENLLSHKDGINKLRVFEITAEPRDDWISLQVVLAQKLEKAKVVTGKLSLKLKGIQAGKGEEIDLIKQFKLNNDYEFKYFQVKKYTISLPNGFNPTTLLVELKGKNKQTISELFQWSDVIKNSTNNETAEQQPVPTNEQ